MSNFVLTSYNRELIPELFGVVESCFHTKFKKFFNCSPTKYREQHGLRSTLHRKRGSNDAESIIDINKVVEDILHKTYKSVKLLIQAHHICMPTLDSLLTKEVGMSYLSILILNNLVSPSLHKGRICYLHRQGIIQDKLHPQAITKLQEMGWIPAT